MASFCPLVGNRLAFSYDALVKAPIFPQARIIISDSIIIVNYLQGIKPRDVSIATVDVKL